MIPAARQKHIFGLDIIRFLAALSVAVFHMNWRYAGSQGYAPWGWIGVQVFFVISGIVITASAESGDAWKFAFGRFLRLYPGAWVCAAITVFALLVFRAPLVAALGVPSEFSIKGLYGSIVLYSIWHLSSAYWTLPLEIAFYAYVAAFLFVGRRINSYIWHGR